MSDALRPRQRPGSSRYKEEQRFKFPFEAFQMGDPNASPSELSLRSTYSFKVNNDFTVGTTLFVDESLNRVGVGTISPDYTLDVDGDIGISANSLLISNVTDTRKAYIELRDLSSGDMFIQASDGGGTNRDIILQPTAGKVGIGTSNPSGALDIDIGGKNGTISTTYEGHIQFADASGGTSRIPLMIGVNDNNNTGLHFLSATNDTNAGADMIFSVRENNSSPFSTLTKEAFSFSHYTTKLLTILRNGKVGINNDSPTYMLDIEAGSEGALQLRTTSSALLYTVREDDTAGGNYWYAIKDSASPADGDDLWLMRVYGRDSAGNITEYNRILCESTDVTLDSWNSRMTFYGRSGGGLTPFMSLEAPVYSNSVTGRDVYVTSGNVLGYLSSTENDKKDIKDVDETSWLYDVKIKNYKRKDDNKELVRYGVIAEEVYKIDKRTCNDYVEEDGRVVGVNKDTFIFTTIKELQKLEERVRRLEDVKN